MSRAREVGDLGSVVTVDDGNLIINESGADVDFRVEGDTEPNLLFVDASTNRVGIGTNAPSNTLEVKSPTNDNGIRLSNGVGSYYHLVISNGDGLLFDADAGNTGGTGADIRFQIKGGEKARITSSGNVLVGTTSAATSSTLNVVGSGYQPIYVNTTNEGGGGASFQRSGTTAIFIGTAGSSWLSGSSTADGLIRAEANMLFSIGNTEHMRIDSNGKVGIGTNAPINELTFGPTTSIISPDTTDGSDSKRLRFCGGGAAAVSRGAYVTVYGNEYSGAQGELTLVAGDAVGGNIVFYTGSAVERMRIDFSGNVGIGTTSPNYTSAGSSSRVLAVSSPTAGDGVAFLNLNGTRTGGGVDSCAAVNFFNNGTANPLAAIFGVRNATDTEGMLTFRTSDTERMRIDSSGNLGVGTTGISARLHVNTSAPTITTMQSTAANGGYLTFSNGSTVPLYIGFGSTLTAGLSTSDAALRYSNNLVFSSSSTEKMRIDSSGYLRLAAGGGIQFNGNTAADDALDDYEEGTWTATMTTTGTDFTTTGRGTTGFYTKIGNLVTAFFDVYIIDPSSGTGNFVITGFPFASSSNTYVSSMIAWGRVDLNGAFTAYGDLYNGTTMYFRYVQNGNTAQTLVAADLNGNTTPFMSGSITYRAA